MRKRLFAALVLVAVGLVPAAAEERPKIDRSIGKEPAYRSKERGYCLLVFGREAKTRAWLVFDGDDLYVDRNANGDLTEEGEKVAWKERSGDRFNLTVAEESGGPHRASLRVESVSRERLVRADLQLRDTLALVIDPGRGPPAAPSAPGPGGDGALAGAKAGTGPRAAVTISTDKTRYRVGEVVRITRTVRNEVAADLRVYPLTYLNGHALVYRVDAASLRTGRFGGGQCGEARPKVLRPSDTLTETLEDDVFTRRREPTCCSSRRRSRAGGGWSRTSSASKWSAAATTAAPDTTKS
ncbi:MAG TPA: hypothetical protein VKJ47_13060 [Candidatus Binatia bacterium]|nr:hypothetical protein [Candidatus Binatia bacterium]